MIKTYPEMNEKIKDLLQLGGENYELYAHQRIVELEEITRKYENALKQIKTSYNSEDAKNIAYMALYTNGIE